MRTVNHPVREVALRDVVVLVEPGFASGEKSTDGVAQVRMNNVTTEGQLDWSSVRRVPATPQQIRRYQLRDGDVLFNSTNSPELVGKAAMFRETGEPTVFSNHFLRVRPKAGSLDGGYLVRWLNVLWKRRHFENRCAQWVNQAAFRKEDLLSIGVPLPPLTEQRRIGAILDKADAIRRKRQQALQATGDLVQAFFLETVGPNHPDYATWPFLRIADLASKRQGAIRTGPFGSDLRHSEFVDKGVAVLGIDNAVNNRFEWAQPRFITVEKFRKLERYRVYPGDVIVTIMGTTGRSAVVPQDIPTAISTKHLGTITPNLDLAGAEFLSNAIHRHPAIVHQLRSANRGAIMPGLNLGLLKALKLPLPPLKDQAVFSNALASIRALQSNLARHSDRSGDLMASLVQRAFRGDLLTSTTRISPPNLQTDGDEA